MTVYITLELLHVSRVGKAGFREGVPKSSRSGEEAIGVESSLTSKDLYCVGMGSDCLSGLSGVFTSRGVRVLVVRQSILH